ncbi:MAG: hypothetical protein PHO48_02560 [Candidatus Gracilibacteria bacterium]|nr:hypothetical protein [Candidatus Gracilibacteria bacterium]MDD5179419.1 hypothetical protein [Candidatus Gracilibacteria bacterium]
MKIELDVPKLISVGETPESRKKIHEILGWVDYCKNILELCDGIKNRLRWAQEVADDLTRETIDVLKTHLDDLNFLLANLTEESKSAIDKSAILDGSEMQDVSGIQRIKKRILKIREAISKIK